LPGGKYPEGEELSTEEIKGIILKLKKQTKIRYLAISGGEPLLRKDAAEIISFCSDNQIETNLLTNGSLLSEQTCGKCVQAGTSIFEIPLLTVDEQIHYELTGRDNLNDIIQGIKNLKRHDSKLVVAFVATKLNIKHIKRTVETAVALGADGIMFNRFNVGGEGLLHFEKLVPSFADIKEALTILDELAGYYGVSASVAVPIPKCLLDNRSFKNISFGYCPSGNEKSYFTIDPVGNVRICNHSPTILGNLLEQDFKTITANKFIENFQRALPDYCTDCRVAKSCWGGCKAAAQVFSDNVYDLDPFLRVEINKQ
jgi:radical SAM protein with 4Fe4S-binding SPASM domain